MNTPYCMVLVTAGNQQEAEKLAEMLIEQRLAACVQITPITSFYTWQGKLNKDTEYLLAIKTRSSCFPILEEAVLKAHSYETPEIIQVPISQGTHQYLAWIDANTKC